MEWESLNRENTEWYVHTESKWYLVEVQPDNNSWELWVALVDYDGDLIDWEQEAKGEADSIWESLSAVENFLSKSVK